MERAIVKSLIGHFILIFSPLHHISTPTIKSIGDRGKKRIREIELLSKNKIMVKFSSSCLSKIIPSKFQQRFIDSLFLYR